MKMMIACFAAAAMLISGCAAAPPPGMSSTEATVVDVVAKIAKTNAQVAAATAAVQKTASSKTVVDLITDAWNTFDTALTGIDLLVETGVLVKDSPRALQVRSGVAIVKHALQAATAAQQAGSATDAANALAQAQTALAQVRAAVQQ